MLSNKKKNKEINIFDIFNYIIEKKQLIILVTFLSMMIAYLIGELFPQRKNVNVKIREPQIHLFLDYSNFLDSLSPRKSNFNIISERKNSLDVDFIYENNYVLFVFLENFKRNLLSKKLMESYLKEKGINDSYDISCGSKDFFCNDINVHYSSQISEKEVLDIINHFYQITKKNHIIFLQDELKKKYYYYSLTHSNKKDLIFLEKETKNFLSQLENNYFDINFIDEIEVGTINSKNQILNNMILGFVFGFFLSLFLIFLRFGYQNFRFEKKY